MYVYFLIILLRFRVESIYKSCLPSNITLLIFILIMALINVLFPSRKWSCTYERLTFSSGYLQRRINQGGFFWLTSSKVSSDICLCYATKKGYYCQNFQTISSYTKASYNVIFANLENEIPLFWKYSW